MTHERRSLFGRASRTLCLSNSALWLCSVWVAHGSKEKNKTCVLSSHHTPSKAKDKKLSELCLESEPASGRWRASGHALAGETRRQECH